MKVAHLTSAHPRYDTRIFLKQCRSLASAGHEVTLVVADGHGDERRDDVNIADVGKLPGRRNRIFRTTRRVLERARALEADIYHLHDPELMPIGRRLKRQGTLDLVVVDYLQLIEPDNPRDPRQEQVARISRRLKGLARELNVPVLCLAQLNRQAERTATHKPQLSHLRESGAIEQDADVVMLLYREDYYNRETDQKNTCDVIVAKNRTGPTDQVKLAFIKEYTRFENLAVQPPA